MKNKFRTSINFRRLFSNSFLVLSISFMNGTNNFPENNINFNGRLIVSSENLNLNNNDSLSFVTAKNEAEGVKDMETIVKSSFDEECWLYLPASNKWYETGINRSFVKDSLGNMLSRVEQDYDFLEELLKINSSKNIIIYHNHPSLENMIGGAEKINPINTSEYEKLVGYSISNSKSFSGKCKENNNYEITRNLLKESFSLESSGNSKPSVSDLKLMVYSSLRFKDSNVINKICSTKGITEFYLTNEGKNHYDSLGWGNYDDFLKNSIVNSYEDSISIRNNKMNILFKPFKKSKKQKIN